MAERIVSPGVFTQENDLSFLPVGIGEIGAVIIGGTESGPAFMPVQVLQQPRAGFSSGPGSGFRFGSAAVAYKTCSARAARALRAATFGTARAGNRSFPL